jgi:hypothetical protein
MGPTGATGESGERGSKWYTGTGITATSATATVFSGSVVASALVGDMDLNSSPGNYYTCTVGGDASTAQWSYTGSLPAVSPYEISNTQPSRACIWFDTSVS